MLRSTTGSCSMPRTYVSLFATIALGALMAACGAAEIIDHDSAVRHDGSDAVHSDATDAIFADHASADVHTVDASDAGASDAANSGAPDCGTPPTAVPYADRLTNAEFTDPPSCSGCPGAFSGLAALNTALPPNATTVALDGMSAGATSCEWYVIGGACGVTHGTLLTDPDGGGNFQTNIPVFCGTNTVRIVCSNAAGHRVYVRQLQGTQCTGTGRDLRVTLTWDNLGTDMELHLVRPGGHINTDPDDCTWYTCVSRQPMWGPDVLNDPHKDVDNVSFYGPENIYLDRAPAGTYNILVEFWGGGSPSTNQLDITIREHTVAHLTHAALPVHWVWYVGSVTFPAGTFTPADRLTNCTANWRITSRGCDLALP